MGAEKLIFPGVGAFEQAMGVLRSKEYTEPIREYIQVCMALRSRPCQPGMCDMTESCHIRFKAVILRAYPDSVIVAFLSTDTHAYRQASLSWESA